MQECCDINFIGINQSQVSCLNFDRSRIDRFDCNEGWGDSTATFLNSECPVEDGSLASRHLDLICLLEWSSDLVADD